MLQIVKQNFRWNRRVSRLKGYATSTFRFVVTYVHLKAIAIKRGLSVVSNSGRQEVVLNVRPLYVCFRANEGARFKVIRSA